MDIITTVKQHASFYPDQAAIKYNDDILTYKELEQFSNTLAKHIEVTIQVIKQFKKMAYGLSKDVSIIKLN